MKKIIALLLAALLIAAVSAGVAADTALAGDCNGDGELDNKDVVVLFRFVSGGAEGVVESNCDFNGDGVTDNKDVVALFRHLSGSEGETDAPEYNDGVIGGKDPSGRDPEPLYPDRPDYYPDTGYEGIEEEEVIGDYEPVMPTEPSETGEYPIDVNYPDPVAGTISAGEWKDADNIEAWKQLLSGEEWQKYINGRNLDTTNVIAVKVVDGESACFNVPVRLMAADSVIYAGRTDVNGYAYLFYDMTAGDNAIPDSVAAGEAKVSLDGRTELEIEAKDAGIEVTALDLMLMIDTTGSMGDELEYIKAELYDVVERVAKADESLSIRVSVNFYRDEGDDYVVKYYDFRSDVSECVEQIKAERAWGGGDYPEAVHTALDNAVTGHNWRDEAVKICFIVLDAPPHSEYEIQGVNAELLKTVKTAAEQGIRIIPVASSGVNEETEFLLRSWALMTGGTYVFITDDSGIGYGHQEAEVGEHTVEYLNNCMVRVVCEYCGIYAGEVIPYTPPYHQ